MLFAVLVFGVIRNHPPDREADVSVNTDTGAIRVVTSAIDTRVGIRAAWSHPGTRLAFWSHFTTPFAGTAFIMLWGIPFLTAGEGATPAEAAAITTVLVLSGIAIGPVMGMLVEPHAAPALARAGAADRRGADARVARRDRVARARRRCGCCSCSRSRSPPGDRHP